MVRSPFFILLLFFFFSCEKRQTISSTFSQEIEDVIQAKAWQKKAKKFEEAKEYDSAVYYYVKSKNIFIKEKENTGNITYNCVQAAWILQVVGDYIGSEEMLTEAEKYNPKKDINYAASIANLYGIIEKENGHYDEAIQNYKKVLSFTKDPLARLSPLNNMATIYIATNKYNKAIDILDGILKSKILETDTLQDKKARYMDNLGYAVYKSGRDKEGLSLMEKALSMRNKIGDTYGSIESYLHLTDYHKNSSPQQSIQYAKMAYKNATDVHSVDERLEALSFLMVSDHEKDARKYASTYQKVNDSIITIRNNEKKQFAKIIFDSTNEKEENQKLRAEKAEDSLKMIVISTILLLLIIAVSRYYRNKNRIERQRGIKAVYDTETRISKKLHDELANDVFQVMSFAETQNLENPNKKELLLDNLDKIYGNARNISRENSSIDTGEDFDSELKQMLVNYENGGLKVIIKNSPEINWAKLPSTSKVAVFRVLQELMVNMKKHSQSTIVVISFETIKNALQIKYSDNGIGFSNKLSLKNGLQNAETRIKAINGVITFDTETEKGFKVKITIPN
ncbi:tetratricopeptide repeat protein [Flavobacterium endophyticum]|uniref:histidine kinase n=1 Tax=Flavobacterium endophyticum TaxID=1540163 RepID=A0A495MCW8_9FLAO|nr:tetratricopeptide repeat-containing sensor histidine kinase [Flavobacterium endophyticum]RKS23165.1 tetratricopeptide repeat protein [Flavobacterium endophyticum]